MSLIHPTAVVSSDAGFGKDVNIGPYAVIEGRARIGEETSIGPHVHVYENVQIGKRCKIYTGAVIGSPPQDLKYLGEKSFVSIGDNNSIREYVTINSATGINQITSIGNNNLLMAYVHIAHNCLIGSNIVIANCATLAGHVTIEDYAVLGGLVGIHQFNRVGRYSITGGCSKITKDILPFIMADGNPARPVGINKVGLKRRNFPPETIKILEKAYKILFTSGRNISSAIEQLASLKETPELAEIIGFIGKSERGIARERE